MFIEQFKLKRNAWYVRLMNYIWGLDERDFSHICPFFWLSLLNVFIITPVFIVKTILKGGAFIITPIYMIFVEMQEKADAALKVKADEIMKTVETNEHYIKLYAMFRDNDHQDMKCTSKLEKAVLHKMYWATDLYTENLLFKTKVENATSELYDAHWKEHERLKLLATKRKDRINNLVKYAKPVGKFLLIILTSAAIIGIGLLLYKLGVIIVVGWPKIKWHGVIVVIGYIGLVAVGICILFFIIYLLAEKYQCATRKFFIGIGKPFAWLFGGIGTIFMIIFQMIKSNCPGIQWND